jgi:hypothetical protein
MKRTMMAMVGLFALYVGACAGEEVPEDKPPSEDEATAVTASFALTAQCGQCASQAVQNVCAQQAQSCINDPNCANVGACVQNCAPNDILCVANCYQQASQLLDILAECVVCQECPVDCDGLWTCPGNGSGGAGGAGGGTNAGGMNAGGMNAGGMNAGGGGPIGVCDNTGFCQACLSCAAQGPCSSEVQACLTDPNCAMDPTLSQAALDCVVCQECANDCAGVNPPIPGGLSCGP